MNEKKQPPVLEGENLCRVFRMGSVELPILRKVSLRVTAGERVAVRGASGAGKTTLLQVLGGLDRPTAGRVLLQGRDLYAMPPRLRTLARARSIGFVFQAYHLLPELDVLENVLLPALHLPGALHSARRLRARAQGLLEQVGLAERAHHLPSELSGGEQQRTALARALMNDPDLVLADEPTGNLDSVTGDQVLDSLFGLMDHTRRTLILVSHDETLARRCDRTLLLHDGRLE